MFPSCSICCSSHCNASFTLPSAVVLQELGELINNLFPCQAERAASLALAARAALFPGESCFPSRALLTEPWGWRQGSGREGQQPPWCCEGGFGADRHELASVTSRLPCEADGEPRVWCPRQPRLLSLRGLDPVRAQEYLQSFARSQSSPLPGCSCAMCICCR